MSEHIEKTPTGSFRARRRQADAAPSDAPLLSVRDLTVTFPTSSGDTDVVKKISFQVERNRTVGIVGESGSGKSMTSLAIMGLLPSNGVTQGSIALGYAAVYARIVRANVIDTLQEDYLRTARAKGLSSALVIRRHALRPSLTPVVTLFGMDFAGLLGGALITETVFGLNGVGKLAADSIAKNDQPVIMGVTLLAAAFVVVGNVVVDVLYTVLDPRVRITA